MLCVNDALFRFERTYKKIKNSGLLDKCEKIVLVMVGKYRNEYYEKLSKLIFDNKIEYFFSDVDKSEVSTINLMYEYSINFSSNNEKYNFLYLHSKGVTLPHLFQRMIGWMDYMEYFLIEEYERCLEILCHYKSCGVCLRYGTRIYGGNFWWASSDLISTLKKLPIDIWRFDCEHWLLNNDYPAFSLDETLSWDWGFYNKTCKREDYTKKIPIVDDYFIETFIDSSEINVEYAIFSGIDCKDIINKCIINNKIYLRSDESIVDWDENIDNNNKYLEIKINNDCIRLCNGEYLIYGY